MLTSIRHHFKPSVDTLIHIEMEMCFFLPVCVVPGPAAVPGKPPATSGPLGSRPSGTAGRCHTGGAAAENS